MSARDVVGHHSSQLKLRKHRCNSSDLLRLSKEDVVRSNVKHVALSSHSRDRNNKRDRNNNRRDRNSNSHAVSRSASSVKAHRKLSVPHNR